VTLAGCFVVLDFSGRIAHYIWGQIAWQATTGSVSRGFVTYRKNAWIGREIVAIGGIEF